MKSKKNINPIKISKHEIDNIVSGTSRIGKGTAIQTAADVLRGNEISNTLAENTEHVKKQEAIVLKEFCKKNGLWIDSSRFDELLGNGAEQDVYFFNIKTVVKTNYVIYYNSWLDYLNNLLVHNLIFSATPYELIGFSDINGFLVSVVKQPFVKATEKVNLKLVKKFLEQKGFVNIKNNDYYNSELGVVLEDLHDQNVLSENGILMFIDTVFYIKQNTDINPIKNSNHEINNVTTGIGSKECINLIEAALNYLKESKSASETDNEGVSESSLLKKYIDKNNVWFSKPLTDENFIGRGNEQSVYLDGADNKFVFKVNNRMFYEGSFVDYFNSLLLHNKFFPSTKYELVGFKVENARLYSVVRQAFINTNETTNTKDVENLLLPYGFVRTNPRMNSYLNEELGITLTDLSEYNVLTKNNSLFFIDTVFYINSETMADGGEVKEPKFKDVKEQVEQRLQEQQAAKEFKDVGRVALTRKEKSAYKLISGAILDQLEEDGVMAYNMVKKENVWPEIDVLAERARGVTAGAAYLKVKIREAVPTRPKDEKEKRATYVLFLENLQKELLECYNVEQLTALRYSYDKLTLAQVIGTFIDPSYLSATDEQKKLIEDGLKRNVSMRASLIYGTSRFVKKLINEVFGAKFENLFFKGSESAIMIWNEAKDKEPISEEQSVVLLEKQSERKAKFIKTNEEVVANYKTLSKADLIKDMHAKWRINGENKIRYKKDPESFRSFVFDYYKRLIERGLSDFEKGEKKLKPRDNDWSWFETPKEKTVTEKPKQQAINTKAPLQYIKRTGGYKIETVSPGEIVEKFGFSAVNYGVYVDDAWSKEHTKHFLGAMSDMGDILNLNIKQVNQLGKLSIAFGAKGRKGHAAAYFPQTKDINMTRGNGDGSVAHEWGHYFDNVIVELDKKQATNQFASEGHASDFEIKVIYKELMDFYYKGNPLYTPKVPMRFFAKKLDAAPSYSKYVDYGWKSFTLEIKPTIEETFLQVEPLMRVEKDLNTTQYRLFGYIIDQFGLEHYDVPMRLKTSYVFHKSAYNYFQYSGTNSAGRPDIVVQARSKYWTSAVELFARAWETVILKKLLNVNRVSNYLVNDIPMEDIISEAYYEPYPAGKELEYIETIIDRLIIAVKKKFDIGDFIPPSNTIEDEYLDLAKSGKVSVGLDVEKEVQSEVKTVTFEGDIAEAIETLELLISLGGTQDQINEWNEKINALKTK